MTALTQYPTATTHVNVLNPQTVTTAGGAVTSAAIDLLDYEGLGSLILHSAKSTAGTGVHLDLTVTECDTSGGSYSTAISGQTLGPVDEVTDYLARLILDFGIRKRYIKVVVTPTGTSGSWIMGVSMTGIKKQR
jgi:hypothetical protein